ncbi:hypothetical protein HALA3H3_710093 [Halomonas sp. A3H3]|nr:hypothetical protein HALA3H3_710093 [Halomonas sp. A3H3]
MAKAALRSKARGRPRERGGLLVVFFTMITLEINWVYVNYGVVAPYYRYSHHE